MRCTSGYPSRCRPRTRRMSVVLPSAAAPPANHAGRGRPRDRSSTRMDTSMASLPDPAKLVPIGRVKSPPIAVLLMRYSGCPSIPCIVHAACACSRHGKNSIIHLRACTAGRDLRDVKVILCRCSCTGSSRLSTELIFRCPFSRKNTPRKSAQVPKTRPPAASRARSRPVDFRARPPSDFQIFSSTVLALGVRTTSPASSLATSALRSIARSSPRRGVPPARP